MYSCGPLHMDEQKQDNQLEPTYSSSVPIRYVATKTCRKQWIIEKGGKKESGISVRVARREDETFAKRICPKRNEIAWMEWELTFYNHALQQVYHYITSAISDSLFIYLIKRISISSFVLKKLLKTNFLCFALSTYNFREKTPVSNSIIRSL